MENKNLTRIMGEVAALSGQVDVLAKAQAAFGEIKTYFGSYTIPIGLEFEMEGCSEHIAMLNEKYRPYYWKATQDGSLRNNGVEMISKPLLGHNVDYALHE